MADYSLNTGLPEQPRTLDDHGFHGILNSTAPPTAYRGPDRVATPGEMTHPLSNAVNTSSDTTKLDVPEAAGDIARRKANG